jgi:CheY-like chemotaxis protein
MMTALAAAPVAVRRRAPQTVVIVGTNPLQHQLLVDNVLDTLDYEVVQFALAGRAYSQIKRVKPDLVILCLSMDEPDGCQVLSMLKADRETAHVPVVTYTQRAE